MSTPTIPSPATASTSAPASASASASASAAGWAAPLTAPECWLDTDETLLEVRAVLQITPDVRSFHFATTDGSVFAFEPGQFITLELEIDGHPVSRCYTVSSPPTRPNLISITVKRVPGGPVSNWLHDNVIPGMRLRVKAPLGAFTLQSPTAAKYLFLSAGSGITPLMSMTRTLTDLCSDADVLFVHSARTPADIIFRRELEALTAINPNVRVMFICEDDAPTERWSGLRGRLTQEMLTAIAPDLSERLTYTCGPALYMASVRNILQRLGYDLRHYHEESYNFATLSADLGAAVAAAASPDEDGAAAAVDPESVATTYTVEFVRSGVTVQCHADTFLLDAAYAADIRVPSSCTQGMCGTCKSGMLDGEVDMHHNGGIRPREIAANKILLCCSKPLSDLRIDV